MPKATPGEDLRTSKDFEWNGEVYSVREKFKMFKFFKELDRNPVTAIALALEDESLARIEEIDMDMDDFKDLLEIISQTMVGTSSGN